MWLVSSVASHVSIELSNGWVFLATGGTLVPGEGGGEGGREGEGGKRERERERSIMT